MALVPPRVRAPEFSAGQWLNTPQPLRMADLRGHVVLVHIWDFTCINCLRTLPYITAWHRAYRHLGVVFAGVHTPEFTFAKEARQVEAALRRYNIHYPVLLDNEQETWDAYANRYWPTVYLIDAAGYIRYQHAGEGAYAETEAALAQLVQEAAPFRGNVPGSESLPHPVGTLREEDQPGAVCFRTTPELHAGYNRGALGNPEGYLPRSLPTFYRLPPKPQREDGYFYVEGTWQAGDEYLALYGERGVIALPYHAATANAVLSVSADPVELMLDLKPPITVSVTQDGQPLDRLTAGEDIVFDGSRSLIRVDAPRMYQIARNPDARRHELRLEATQRGLAVFAFSFTTCVLPQTTGT